MASNPNYPDKPGYGTLFFVAPEDKKHPQGPDFTGHVVLDMDYKAGERLNFGLWQKQTKMGTTMFSVREDNWLKKKKLEDQQPKELHLVTLNLENLVTTLTQTFLFDGN